MENLTEQNFMFYAVKYYDGIVEDEAEFLEDLSRIVYVKRLLNKYQRTKDLKERLILNHLIILHNVFGINSIRMIFLKIPEYHSQLKTFLDFISLMPDEIPGVNGQTINSGSIPIDYVIAKKLQEL